jgi:hypothetical protein
LVKGVKDNQSVPDARPLAPDTYVGPISIKLSRNAAVGSTIIYLENVVGLTVGDQVGIMMDLDGGVYFNTYIIGIIGSPEAVAIAAPLRSPASSGNLLTDYKVQKQAVSNMNFSSVILINGNVLALPGAAVYISGAGSFGLAQANSFSTSFVAGLTSTAIAPLVAGILIIGGPLSLTTAQWDAVTGQVGGLTPGAVYFLDPFTAGHITTAPPTTPGQVVTIIGQASSATQMIFKSQMPVLL